MTVPNQTPRTVITGSGITGPFSFTWKLLSITDLAVSKYSSAGVKTSLAYPADYAVSLVSGGAGGGTVTTTVAIAIGETLVIERATQISQLADITNQGDFYPETQEDAFDKSIMILQEQQDEANRSVKAPATDSTSLDMSLPPATNRANKVLAFSGTGTPIASTLDLSAIEAGSVSAAASAAAAAASASAANTSAGNASTSETNASNSAIQAANTIAPSCRLVAAANVTLSGTQTIDGVVGAAGDAILCVGQTSTLENGPWLMQAGAWTRPAWYAAASTTQAFFGRTFDVALGSTLAGAKYYISTTGAITIGTTGVAFTRLPVPNYASAETLTGAKTFSGTVSISGTFTVSAATASLGTSTAASTVNIGTGATIAAATKTVNIGTTGVSTSITVVNIGSAVAGSLGRVILNHRAAVARVTELVSLTTTALNAAISVQMPITTGQYVCMLAAIDGPSVDAGIVTAGLYSVDEGSAGATGIIIGAGNSSTVNEVARFSSDKKTTLAGVLDISGATAGNIVFPATQVASAGANTLDDYEEGTWTPSYQGSTTNPTVTYTAQEGKYTKIGDTVHIWGRIVINTITGGSGYLIISGLPFVCGAAESNRAGFVVGITQSWVANSAPQTGVMIGVSENRVALFQNNTSNANDNQSTTSGVTNAQAGSAIWFQMTYKVN